MASVSTAFLLLCTCLCAQASEWTWRPPVTLHSLTRIDMGTSFKLYASYSYWGPGPLGVEWTGPGVRELYTDLMPAMATLEVNKTELAQNPTSIYLDLGNKTSQYFRITWNMAGSGHRTAVLHMDQSTVYPDTDVVYTPGTTANVNIFIGSQRGYGHFNTENHPQVFFHCAFMRGNEAVVRSCMETPFFNVSTHDQYAGTWNTVSFSDDKPINGWFSGELRYEPFNMTESPVEELTEVFQLTVHDSSHSGPFPEGFAQVEFFPDEVHHTCTLRWGPCKLLCIALTNDDLEDAWISKANGGPTAVIDSFDTDMGYGRLVYIFLDAHDPTTPGDYVCKANTRDGKTVEKKITIVVTE